MDPRSFTNDKKNLVKSFTIFGVIICLLNEANDLRYHTEQAEECKVIFSRIVDKDF